MPKYAAFLRGVMPGNVTMAALKRRFEKAGFTGVRTVLGSGNVVFTARAAPSDAKVTKAAGMAAFVRSIDHLAKLAAGDPFAKLRGLDPKAKRVVTFLRKRPARLKLPLALGGARILAVQESEAFSAYLPGPEGPVFMTLIGQTFGDDVTTRTWQTVTKVVSAALA